MLESANIVVGFCDFGSRIFLKLIWVTTFPLVVIKIQDVLKNNNKSCEEK